MTLHRVLTALLAVAAAVSTSFAADPPQPTLGGRWIGYFIQPPGGPEHTFIAEATLKQDDDVVTGELRIQHADKPEFFVTTTVMGKLDKNTVVLKDDKVVDSKAKPLSRWLTDRTFTAEVGEFGSISGAWMDSSDTNGKGTFALVRMAYTIDIKRGAVNDDGLIPGELYLNGIDMGTVYENPKFVIPAGEYAGRRRATSEKNFVQGPGGVMGKRGDFLLEVAGVPNRSDILIHPGDKPEHSEGCILAGPATRKSVGKSDVILAPPLLAALRLQFYGQDRPSAGDAVYAEKEKGVVIRIKDPEKR